MTITKVTFKGQLLLPVALRRKYDISPDRRVAIIDRDGEIVIRPLEKDPVKGAFGVFADQGGLLKDLIAEKAQERQREK